MFFSARHRNDICPFGHIAPAVAVGTGCNDSSICTESNGVIAIGCNADNV